MISKVKKIVRKMLKGVPKEVDSMEDIPFKAMGKNVQINSFNSIHDKNCIEIGNNVYIGGDAYIWGGVEAW